MAVIPQLNERMEQGVSGAVFPGAVLLVQRAGLELHHSAHGRTAGGQDGRPIQSTTLFDLASLTKVLATTGLALQARERAELKLSDRLGQHLPGLNPDLARGVTVEQLLGHTSGLPAWRAYYQKILDSESHTLVGSPEGLKAMRKLVAAQELQQEPGLRIEYSDPGFILLHWLLEEVAQQPLQVLFEQGIARPLNLDDLFFIDLKDPAAAQEKRSGRIFAATERCPWRGRVLSGEVHDDNAFCMGGVAGHAGLFGTARAVARVAQAWLDGALGRAGLFNPELVSIFLDTVPAQGSPRALGFDKPASEGSQAGKLLSRKSFGHLGFSGTSVWVDPERQLVVVLLSNRIHPRRDNDAIRRFRPGLHDLVVAQVDKVIST